MKDLNQLERLTLDQAHSEVSQQWEAWLEMLVLALTIKLSRHH
ncbi:hypothetical protein [Stenomitos frigidus]|nr:hypothetical protein [Stenomitos frigidus]